MEKQLAMHGAVADTQCSTLAVQAVVAAVTPGCSTPRCPLALSKYSLGVPHWLNSFPALCYSASCLQRADAKTKLLSYLPDFFFFLVNAPSNLQSSAPQQGFMSPGLCPTMPSQLPPCQSSDHWQSLILTPDIPMLNPLHFGLPQELRREERVFHHPKHKLLQPN